MHQRVKQLIEKATVRGEEYLPGNDGHPTPTVYFDKEKFAELIVEAVLDQVKERAYYTGDRDWSDEVDRPWIQLEFGYGSLADARKGIFK